MESVTALFTDAIYVYGATIRHQVPSTPQGQTDGGNSPVPSLYAIKCRYNLLFTSKCQEKVKIDWKTPSQRTIREGSWEEVVVKPENERTLQGSKQRKKRKWIGHIPAESAQAVIQRLEETLTQEPSRERKLGLEDLRPNREARPNIWSQGLSF